MRRLAILILPAVLSVLLAALGGPTGAAAAEPFDRTCPAEALEEGAEAELNHNPVAKRSIVPGGATSLRLCRYYGFGEFGKQTPKTQARAGQLQEQAVVDSRPVIEGLTLEFRELNAPPLGPIHCPADEGAELYAVFFYPHAKPVILRVSLSGCRFVVGAVPRARWLNSSLEHKLLRLVGGQHVKAPKHGKVTENSVAQHRPPHLKIAKARRMVQENLAEDCAGLCTASNVVGCERKTAAIVVCRVEATLQSGEVCDSRFTLRELEGGPVVLSPKAGNIEDPCVVVFFPPEIREHIAEETKAAKRGYDRPAGG